MRQVFQAPACHTHTQLLKQSPKDLRALFLFCFICLSRAFGACQLQVSVSFELGVPGRLGDGLGDGVSDLLGRLEQYPEGCNGKALWLGHRRGTQRAQARCTTETSLSYSSCCTVRAVPIRFYLRQGCMGGLQDA